MVFWDDIKKDMGKHLKDGFEKLKLKAGELSDEGKKKYRVFELKTKTHKEMADLGAMLYAMRGSGANPLDDAKVKVSIDKIAKLEESIRKIEAAGAKAPSKKKAASKKSTAKKKTASRKKMA